MIDFKTSLSVEFKTATVIMPNLNLQFNSSVWNTPEMVGKRNCFAYALDELSLGFAWPGRLVNKDPVRGKSTHENMMKDGFIPIHQHSLDPVRNHIFAYDDSGKHFIRLDADGTWSHKAGSNPATNRDKKGDAILDPFDATLYFMQSHKPQWEFYTIPETGIPYAPEFF